MMFLFGLTVRLSTMNMGSLQTFMKQHIQVGFCSFAQVLSTSVQFFSLFLHEEFSKVMHVDGLSKQPIIQEYPI